MITEVLNNMLSEQKNYNGNKTDLMLFYIEERLEKSFNVYQEELNKSFKYLASRQELGIMKRLTRNHE